MGDQYRIPDKCCKCLGPADTTFEASFTYTSTPMQTTYSLAVPICRACQIEQTRNQWIIGISVTLSAGLFGALIGPGVADWGWGGGLFLGVFIGGLIFGLLHNYVLQPVQIRKDGSGIFFRNLQFNEEFRRMNGLPLKNSDTDPQDPTG